VLAPLLLLYLVLDWLSHSPSRLARGPRAAVGIALVMAQSKTTWLIGILLLLVRAGYAALRLRGTLRYMVLLLLGAGLAAGIVGILAISPVEQGGALSGPQGNSLRTLTGRTEVWAVTLQLWRANPLFGYGPGLWSGVMRLRYARIMGWLVPHAHNQLLQTLGEAGLIGAAGLIAHVGALVTVGVRESRVTHGASLALVLALLLRGITEVPMRTGTGPDSSFLLHMLTFGALVLLSRDRVERNRLANEVHPLPVRAPVTAHPMGREVPR